MFYCWLWGYELSFFCQCACPVTCCIEAMVHKSRLEENFFIKCIVYLSGLCPTWFLNCRNLRQFTVRIVTTVKHQYNMKITNTLKLNWVLLSFRPRCWSDLFCSLLFQVSVFSVDSCMPLEDTMVLWWGKVWKCMILEQILGNKWQIWICVEEMQVIHVFIWFCSLDLHAVK